MADSQNVNATATENWNITTLKAHVESLVGALRTETELKFLARDKAQQLQHQIDQEHFKALNNENARILKATEVTVSRDTWDGFKESDQRWKSNAERLMAEAMKTVEFQNYKEATERALNLGAGKWQGILVLITTVASLAAIAGVIMLATRTPH